MQTMVSSQVWQRRTNKIIAMATIIIGLTMMISMIPQCIYIGLILIVLSLGWLAWMRMKERKAEPPTPPRQPHAAVSPVLFLVASQNFTQRQCVPTPADPNDRPPSYDQIIKLDGLPPDYFTILSAKPPRYEDLEGVDRAWSMAIPMDSTMACLPTVHSYTSSCSSNGSYSGAGHGPHGPLTPLTLEVPSLCGFVSSGSSSPDEGTKCSQDFHPIVPAEDEPSKPANEAGDDS